jgi:Ca-activated chloride channel family protein
MNESANEARLKRMTAPPSDPQARLAAKRAALAEFARVQAANDEASRAASQGSDAPQRLSRQSSRGRFAMNWLVPRGWSGAFASLCVVALGTSLMWPMISRQIDPVTWFESESDVGALSGEMRDSQPAEAAPATPDIVNAVVDDEAARAAPTMTELEVFAPEAAPIVPRPEIVIDTPADSAPAPAQPGADMAELFVRQQPVRSAGATTRLEAEGVVVTGTRQSLANARESKRDAVAVVDAIHAEDIGRSPDAKGKGRTANPKLAANAAPSRVAIAISEQGVVMAQPEGNDKFRHFDVNPIKRVAQDPVSTFSVDVDTASYAFVRRALNAGSLPPQDSVRVEEMINYFDYAWPLPGSRKEPFEPTIVVSDSPWAKGKKLVHVAIKGYEIPRNEAPDVNLVLLLDVSGSMNSPDKLPLAVQSMELLVGSLKPTDTIGIVVYAGAAGMVLEPTPVSEKTKILAALRSLTPGGSTAGAAGIELAYKLAEANFRKGGVNRILLATDGDFNVGIADTEQLKGFVERKRENGVMLSVLGFGRGNYRDELSQALAQNGNGVAAYIDSLSEAQKVLVQESSGTLFTIAKDVKIQVEFNPASVAEYRLIGYETRALNREDFNNDAVDAGDVGAGHTVTAIYEITPVGSGVESVDPLRYGAEEKRANTRNRNEYGFLKMRYKLPGERRSKLIERPIPLSSEVSTLVGREVKFSTAVAGFAQLLRGAAYTGELTYDDVIREAQGAKGDDEFGYRAELVQLVRKAQIAKGM